MPLKEKRVVLKKWLNAARGERCTWPGCGCHDQTIVAAHSNLLIHGRGMGRKADDLFIAFLCSTCHYEYDYGTKMERQEKSLMFMMAMSTTWKRLFERGLLFLAPGEPHYADHIPF